MTQLRVEHKSADSHMAYQDPFICYNSSFSIEVNSTAKAPDQRWWRSDYLILFYYQGPDHQGPQVRN